MLQEVPTLKYNELGKTGMKLSNLAFGGSAIGGVFSQVDDQSSINVVREALKHGINFIDTAPWYGNSHSESVLGQALQGVPRESYYIATKVGRYDPNIETMFDFSAEKTFKSFNESLHRLKLDYVDLIQVHDLEFALDLNQVIYETLPALQKIKESGRAKFIGITGYPLKTLIEVVEKSPVKIDTVLSYCRCCLFDNTLSKYEKFLKEKGIGIINASALGMGLLTNKSPPHWHPAGQEIKTACAEAAKYCKERDVDISRLALAYALKQKGPTTHLVSVAELDLLFENVNIAMNGLRQREEMVLQEILERYFAPLPVTHWEDIEPLKYKEKLKKLHSKRK